MLHTVSVMPHEHLLNHCTVPGCHENPTSRSLRKVLKVATAANIVWGGVSIAVGAASGSSAAFADGIHSASDGFSHAMHTGTHKAEEQHAYDESDQNNRRIKLRRYLAAGAITVGALVAGYNAYDDFANPMQTELNTPALAVELGATAMNGALLILVRKRNDGSLAFADSLRHHKIDTTVSALAASSIILNPVIPGADSIGGFIAAGASGFLAYKIATDAHHH